MLQSGVGTWIWWNNQMLLGVNSWIVGDSVQFISKELKSFFQLSDFTSTDPSGGGCVSWAEFSQSGISNVWLPSPPSDWMGARRYETPPWMRSFGGWGLSTAPWLVLFLLCVFSQGCQGIVVQSKSGRGRNVAWDADRTMLLFCHVLCCFKISSQFQFSGMEDTIFHGVYGRWPQMPGHRNACMWKHLRKSLAQNQSYF